MSRRYSGKAPSWGSPLYRQVPLRLYGQPDRAPTGGNRAARSGQTSTNRPLWVSQKLAGDRAGQHGIRVSQQWRIWFRWTGAGPGDVEITGCH